VIKYGEHSKNSISIEIGLAKSGILRKWLVISKILDDYHNKQPAAVG